MKKIVLIAVLGMFLSLTACSGDDDNSNPEVSQVEIRIRNASTVEYTDIIVNTSGGENTYGDLSSDVTSEYKTFDFAYRYAYIELKINGEIFTIQPIDYVGETKLTPGKYTYEIGAGASTNQFTRLSLKFIED
ncbi:hypothetical protein GWK08_14835 [Leptobacterium flavescens]|uniref:DUF4377 domain-containing protein n=1 Tax=Leptobacterium flavescens TaxID=472055 RepID=A0A6P0UQH4_9FLAO|nr:hypothetical protein [Leptobacterium flavescens]NER14730.1 hypothetical protein [Leptobacterium flavescens]